MIYSDELKGGSGERWGKQDREKKKKRRKKIKERIIIFRMRDIGFEEDFETLYEFMYSGYVSDYVRVGGDFELGVWQQ
jgi:hypothetical protein